MSIKTVLNNVNLSHKGSNIYRGPFTVPDLPDFFKLFLAYDNSSRRISVLWEAEGDEQIPVKGGEIKVKNPYGAEISLKIPSDMYTVTIDVELELEDAIQSPALATIASSALSDAQPNDVRFDFPRVGKSLWANSRVLAAVVPHYKTAFSSAFAEGAPTTTPPTSKMSTPAYDVEESDEEVDDGAETFADKLKSLKAAHDNSASPVRVVIIKDFSFETYWATLLWLHSRHIAFAPLLSSFRTGGKSREEALPLRASALAALPRATDTRLPPPVSPRSVFRLAHYLGLEELAKLALEDLKSKLSASTVAYELYSDVATLYPEVRDVVLEFVVKNWAGVKSAAATEEMEKRAENGELSAGAGVTAMRLAKRVG